MSKRVKASVEDSNKKREEKAKSKQKLELLGLGVPASLWEIPDESKRDKLVAAVAWAVKTAKNKIIKIESEFAQIKPLYGGEKKLPADIKKEWEDRISVAMASLTAACDAEADVHLAAFEARRKQPPREAKDAVQANDYKEPVSPEDTQDKDNSASNKKLDSGSKPAKTVKQTVSH